MTWRL